MSTKIMIKAVRKLFRAAITGLLLASLFVAGATAARRSYLQDQKDLQAKAAPVVSVATEIVQPPIPADASGSMAKGSRPTTEQVCVFQAGTTPHGNYNQNIRIRDGVQSDLTLPPAHDCSYGIHGPATSLAEAAPLAATVQTLVGAVPSGTM